MDKYLTISHDAALVIEASAEAFRLRDELLAVACKPTVIADKAGAQRAADLLKQLKEFLSSVETARKEAKRPLLDKEEELDQLAKSLCHDVKAQAERISKLVGAWDQAQRVAAEQERRRAWERAEALRRENEARERAEAERLQRERLAREAEAQRVADEARKAAEQAACQAEEKAARARTEAGRERALAAAEAVREQAAAAAQQALDRAELENKEAQRMADAQALARADQEATQLVAVHEAANALEGQRVEGVVTRTDIEFEVIDVVELYEAMPVLVDLVPKRGMIKATLKSLRAGQSLPGIRHWRVSKSR